MTYAEILDKLELQAISVLDAYYKDDRFWVHWVGNRNYYDYCEQNFCVWLKCFEHYTLDEAYKIAELLKG